MMRSAARIRSELLQKIVEDEVRQLLEDAVTDAISKAYGLDRAKVGEVVAQVVAKHLTSPERLN